MPRPPTSHERRAGRPWDDSYREGRAPWDVGRPQPAVAALCEQGAFAGPVLDAGCGTGENALAIAAQGVEVLGIDVAPTAIRQAQEKAAARAVAAAFGVADALRLEDLGRTFATVLDCGLFHTFEDEERARYVAGLAAVTRPGGVLHLLCVSDAVTGEQGPTRRVGEAELRSAFGAPWRVRSVEPARLEVTFDSAGLAAWLAAIERV